MLNAICKPISTQIPEAGLLKAESGVRIAQHLLLLAAWGFQNQLPLISYVSIVTHVRTALFGQLAIKMVADWGSGELKWEKPKILPGHTPRQQERRALAENLSRVSATLFLSSCAFRLLLVSTPLISWARLETLNRYVLNSTFVACPLLLLTAPDYSVSGENSAAPVLNLNKSEQARRFANLLHALTTVVEVHPLLRSLCGIGSGIGNLYLGQHRLTA